MIRRSLALPVAGAFVLVCLASAPAHATSFTIHTIMLGSNEAPPNASPATGVADITLVGDSLTVDETWAGLVGGNPTAAHIHCCAPAGVNAAVAVGFPSFPAALAGTYFHVFNLLDPTVYNAPFLAGAGGTAAGAEAALIAGMMAGNAYVNIHDATYPGGEIRGQLGPVPEPATIFLLGSGLIGAGIRRYRRA